MQDALESFRAIPFLKNDEPDLKTIRKAILKLPFKWQRNYARNMEMSTRYYRLCNERASA